MDFDDHAIIRLMETRTLEKVLEEAEKRDYFTRKVLFYAYDTCRFEHLYNLFIMPKSREIASMQFLEISIANGKMDVIDFFFETKKMDIHQEYGVHHMDALMFACHHGSFDIVVRLLELGADPKRTNYWGQNAYFYASKGPNVKVFQRLYLEAERFDYVDICQRSLLHHACLEMRSHEVFDLLLDNAMVDVNAQDHDGNTPLHLALDQSDKKGSFSEYFITRLVTHPDLDFRIVNRRGRNVWNSCEENHYFRFKKLIKKTLQAKES